MGHPTAPRAAIDVHSHVYLPRYRDLLRGRTAVPRITGTEGDLRLLILPGEDREASTAAGRPVGAEYYEPERKLAYMDAHDIETTLLSLANPWLEFVEPADAARLAALLNDDLEDWCAASGGRFYGFGVLPVTAPDACAAEVERVATAPHLRGIIIGGAGLGRGLDDPRLFPVWERLEAAGLVAFVHPHHGVGDDALFAGTGHTLKLALGFTFETTVALARLILSGTLDRFRGLKILAAHAAGALPNPPGGSMGRPRPTRSGLPSVNHRVRTFGASCWMPSPIRPPRSNAPPAFAAGTG
jgi:aminocarboxymuconate-semialdehyde decarboxylase